MKDLSKELLTQIVPYVKGNLNTNSNNQEDLTTLNKRKKRRAAYKVYNQTTRPDKFGTKNRDESYSYINRLLKLQRVNYYHALLHPYAVCVERSPVCLPMEIPIPTVTTYHMKMLNLTADSNGTLKLRFTVPKILGTSTSVPAVAFSCGTTTNVDANWTAIMTSTSLPNVIKSRNVGIEFRLTYTGKVLDTAGTIESMASYSAGKVRYNTAAVPYACTMGQFTNSPDIDSFGHQMPWFEREPLEPGKVVRCIWVPVDYADRDFHTSYTYAADIVQSEHASDMEWFVLVRGAAANAPFLLEYAAIIEAQMVNSTDIFARNSTLLTNADVNDKQVIQEGIKNRSAKYNKDDSVASALKNLANKGVDYLKKHSAEITTWGLKALGALLV